MSRFDSVDFETVTNNLLEDIYKELDELRGNLQSELQNMSYKEEMFWNGCYSGLLQVEEFVRYLFYSEPIDTADIDYNVEEDLSEKDKFSERVSFIVKYTENTIDSLEPVTSFLYGQIFCLESFFTKLKKLDQALNNGRCDFEEFHVTLKGLIPEVSKHIDSNETLEDIYIKARKDS